MRTKNKESTKLKGLIRIGVFSALWIAVSWLLACTIGFFPPVLLVLPCLLAVIGSMILAVMQSKLTINGGVLISSFLFGLCLFTMAPYGLMFFFTFAAGILGEVILVMTKNKKRSWAGQMMGIMLPMLGLALGEYIPLYTMKEAYRAAYAGSFTEDVLESMFGLFDKLTPLMILLLLVVTILCAFLGFWWGRKIAAKRLAKSGGGEEAA